MLKKAAWLALALASTCAQSQVFRCTNPSTGAITFSDKRCETTEKEVHLFNKVDPRRLMIEQRETQAAQYRLARDKADIEAKERRDIALANSASGGGGGSSWDCQNARKNAATVATSLTIEKKASQQAYMEALQSADVKCGGGESYHTAAQRQKMEEAAKPKPLPPPPPLPDRPAPVDIQRTITSCAFGVCQDDKGDSYRRSRSQLTDTWTGNTCTINKLTGICQ